jgi:transcription termination factor Rho
MAAVLDRPELEASPLADLHAIADQLGLDGFRRLRKAELIDRILGAPAGGDAEATSAAGEEEKDSSERPSPTRSRRRGVGGGGAGSR